MPATGLMWRSVSWLFLLVSYSVLPAFSRSTLRYRLAFAMGGFPLPGILMKPALARSLGHGPARGAGVVGRVAGMIESPLDFSAWPPTILAMKPARNKLLPSGVAKRISIM